jgi:formylglycine-generating enzyme required for sulfatase activity
MMRKVGLAQSATLFLWCLVACGGDVADTSGAGDEDGDGIAAETDCDDADANVGDVSNDADCDGVVTSNDCDDGDANAGPTYATTGCMMRISGGTFDMGCTAGQSNCNPDESPVMPVTLTHDYWIGQT